MRLYLHRVPSLDRVLTLRTALVVGLVVRLLLAAQHSFWNDEAYAFYVSRLSLPDIVVAMVSSDRHPPLYYMLLHVWGMVSTTELWLRLPSIGCALLTITGVYRLAERLTDQARTAAVAALLTATFFVDWQHDSVARMLALAQCGCTWATVALARLILDEEPSPRDALMLCGSLAVAIHSFYFAGGFLVAAALATLVLRPSRRLIWMALGGVALLCAPLAVLVRAQLHAGSVEVYSASILAFHLGALGPYYLGLMTAFQGLTGAIPLEQPLWSWALITVPLLAWQLWSLRGLLTERREEGVLLACVLGGYLGALLLTTATFALFNLRDRYFVPVYPIVHIVTALGLQRATAALMSAVGLNLALVASCLSSSYLWYDDVRPLAERVHAAQRPGDLLLIEQPGTDICVFNYYYDREHFALVRQGDQIYVAEPAAPASSTLSSLPQVHVRELPFAPQTLATIVAHPTVFLITTLGVVAAPEKHQAMMRSLAASYEVDPAQSIQVTTTYGTYGNQTKAALRLVRKPQALPTGR
jgi:Dolichyl-phosphate-mannose-protein mannosyltransferase